MTKAARAVVPILIAVIAAAVPALVLKQTSRRPKANQPAITSQLAGRYDSQMARACEQSCALKIAYKENELAPQPGAPIGALTHCVVSGVVFRVRKDGASAAAGGQTYHFCCGTCARLFRENPGRFASLKSRPA